MTQSLLTRLVNLIKRQNPKMPLSAIHLAIYSCISEMLCFNRVIIDFKNLAKIIPNIYAITFLKSGGGKDLMLKQIQECIPFFNNQNFICNKIYEKNQKKLDEEIKAKQDEGKISKGPAAASRYRSDHPIRYITTNGSDGTVEGMMAMRESLDENNIGHISFINSEFGKYISTNSESSKMLNYLNEVYDGDSKPKMIKSNFHVKAVKNVPQTMFVFSSIEGLVSDDKATDTLKGFFDTGLARRCFMCFPQDSEFGQPIDLSGIYEKELEEINEERKLIKEEFEKIEEKINLYNEKYLFNDYKKINVSKEAEIEYFKYKYSCELNCNKFGENLSKEVEGRYWKALKLAGILSILETDELIITKELMQAAIQFTEGFGKQLSRFFIEIENDLVEKTYQYIKNNPGCGITSIARESKIFGRKKDDSRFIADIINQVSDYCTDLGEILQFEKSKRGSGKYHTIIEIPEHVESLEDVEVKYSKSLTIDLKDTSAIPATINFSEFHKVTCGDTRYLAAHFSKKERLTENYIIGHNLIIFDIDNDNQELPIEEAIEKFKEYKNLIIPTTNHQKEKGKKGVKDRYRIILPTIEFDFNDIDRFKNIIKNIIKEFNIENYCDVPAAGKIALPYRCHKATHVYSKGTKLLNWKVFDYKEINEKRLYQGNKHNVLETAEFKTNNGIRTWNDFEFLKTGKTIPCNCPFPEHEDTNASAYVARHANGNLFVHCVVCNKTYFNK